jgi:hypothetical protein
VDCKISKRSLSQVVLKREGVYMLYMIGDKKESGFEVVIREICSGIQVDCKVVELAKRTL